MDPVEEVKSRLDIVDVISKHVELKRAGRNYKALCPFHSEKTPSFVVFPDTQTWRCFGACAEGGDVYSFVMKKNGWDFGETLRALAEQTGVELRPRTPEQAGREEANARLYDLLNSAALYYMRLLRSADEAEGARDYVVERGLLPHTVEQFQLGYAPNRWDGIRTYLGGKKYTDDEMLSAGLLIEKEDTGRRYDRFRNRLMIPIHDIRGRVVGFGARALEADATPKYLNSPQTDLFDKSTLLYGLDLAKKAIRDQKQVIIVEGYLDVMQGHQAGHSNLVAQMGTALTEAQVRQLKRYSSRLVLALDADAAGQRATLRGLEVARQTLDRQVEVLFDPRGLVRYESRLQADIRIVTLPEGYDPDKLIRSDLEAWNKLILGARPLVEYILDAIIGQIDLQDAKAKSAAVSRALPIIKDVTSAVERTHYTQYLARRLELDERTLVTMTMQSSAGTRRPRGRRRGTRSETQPAEVLVRPASPPGYTPLHQEIHCLGHMLKTPRATLAADRILQSVGMTAISEQDFADPQNRMIFSTLQQVKQLEELEDQLEDTFRARLEAIRAEKSPANDTSTDKVATHLAYTILLMRRKAIHRAKRQLDSVWTEELAHADQPGVGTYPQQVLELETLRLRIDQALAFITNPLANNHRVES